MKEYLPALSLKAMFVLVLAASVASFALASHNFAVAVGLMLCVAVSLVLIASYAVWTRRPWWLLLVAGSVGYLILADGGVFPKAERYLPTELALERCSRGHTELLSGIKFPRSTSLTQWAWRMCLDPDHRDWRHVFWKQHAAAYKNRLRNSSADAVGMDESVDATLDSLLEIVGQGIDSQDVNPMVVGGVRLPAIAMTSVSVVTVWRNRRQAQNRAFYISGHCLVVLSTLAIVVWWKANRRTDS